MSLSPAHYKFLTLLCFLSSEPTSAPIIYVVFTPGDMGATVKTARNIYGEQDSPSAVLSASRAVVLRLGCRGKHSQSQIWAPHPWRQGGMLRCPTSPSPRRPCKQALHCASPQLCAIPAWLHSGEWFYVYSLWSRNPSGLQISLCPLCPSPHCLPV